MNMKRTTEADSNYNDLDKMSVAELLQGMNNEDKTVPIAVEKAIPAIEKVVNVIVDKISAGGRLFYIGAGTSGRLGILDASECPPTFGIPHGVVIGIIAGGDTAIRKAVEFAEDDKQQGWNDLSEFLPNENDSVIGIAASGSTPYVIGTLEKCKQNNILTGAISCNPGSPLSATADFPIEVISGPEFVTGSTRMKAGTAQKLVMNMISTTLMIRLGKVIGNRMVDMQLSNNKLIDRGAKMVMEATGLNAEDANKLLQEMGSVRKAIDTFKK